MLRAMLRSFLYVFVVLAASTGCRKSPGASDAGEPVGPPRLELAKGRDDLLFTYFDADGKLHDVNAADKVPQDRRKQVLVRDLSKRAEEVKADQYVFVADLTREEGGTWPYAVVSRYSVDRSIRIGGFAGDDGDDGDDAGVRRVVVYGTSWCGACAQARSWLRSHKVPFADKDVEKDPRAAATMQRKVERAGMALGGVPVIDVMGTLVLGFDERQMERLLAGAPRKE